MISSVFTIDCIFLDKSVVPLFLSCGVIPAFNFTTYRCLRCIFIILITTYGNLLISWICCFNSIINFYNNGIADDVNFFPELAPQYGKGFRSVLYGLLANLKDAQAPQEDYTKAENLVKALDDQIKVDSQFHSILPSK